MYGESLYIFMDIYVKYCTSHTQQIFLESQDVFSPYTVIEQSCRAFLDDQLKYLEE